MKKGYFLSSLLSLAMLVGVLCCASGLYAQQTPPDQTSPTTQQPPMPDTQSAPSQTPDQSGQTPSGQTSTPSQQQTPDQSGQAPSGQTHTPSGQSSDAAAPSDQGGQTFTGTVVKQGDKYMFQDAATSTTYDIDHQDEVKKFEGKKVRVHGTLDPNTKTIHVQ
jgi:uncharacterized protein YdeI (BOF family)